MSAAPESPVESPAAAQIVDGASLTPMMKQYLEVKAQVPGALLFFRLGDFYELFFEDAVKAAELLQITLTSRAKGLERVPMAGVPYHAARRYIARLIDAGQKVAICEQLTPPGKGIVKREVVRVVTPGMVLDDEVLEARENNFLAAVLPGADGEDWGAALIDASTGEFVALPPAPLDVLADDLARAAPRELLVPDGEPADLEPLLMSFGRRPVLATLEPEAFSGKRAKALLTSHFGVQSLDGFGLEQAGPSVGAAGAALRYVRDTQKSQAAHVDRISLQPRGGVLVIDEASRANLELVRTLKDNARSGSLLGVIDRTATPLGARKLARWLTAPLQDVAAIEARLDAVEALVQKASWREALVARLKEVADVERLCGRLSLASGGPRDVHALGRSLAAMPALAELLAAAPAPLLAGLAGPLAAGEVKDLAATLTSALVDEPPAVQADGGFIRKGYHRELDELIELSSSGKDYLAKLELREREATGIGSLKVRYNKVFGYYLEVTRANLDRVPKGWIRKQTTVGGERYVTEELKTYEEKVLTADEKRIALEQRLFEELRALIVARARVLKAAADAVATLDALVSFARVSAENGYVRPQVDTSSVIELEGGRHPVVEKALGGDAFIPNDVRLDRDEAQVLIITGPNMAGKSTVMRQVALAVVLAQAGCFVPARRARIGVADRVFTRVGASDNLAKGQSTFMVEMTETAGILNHATESSLVLLDEIGRGTSTFDGISIAWATARHLAEKIRCPTLFATHYFELTQLAQEHRTIANVHLDAVEAGGSLTFLHAVQEGPASQSYGLQVARLAGVPPAVVNAARRKLMELENQQVAVSGQGDLFAGLPAVPDPEPHPVLERLDKVDPDGLTPRQALDLIYELKRLIE